MPIKMKVILQRGLLILVSIYLPDTTMFASEGSAKDLEKQISLCVVKENVISNRNQVNIDVVLEADVVVTQQNQDLKMKGSNSLLV